MNAALRVTLRTLMLKMFTMLALVRENSARLIAVLGVAAAVAESVCGAVADDVAGVGVVVDEVVDEELMVVDDVAEAVADWVASESEVMSRKTEWKK